MKPRIVYIHGNSSTHWSFGWAQWLRDELETLGYPTFFETFPDSVIARAKYWLPFLQDFIKVRENDVIVGWSSGATAALRYAENHTIAGSILVSPCYTDLGDDMEKQSGYYDTPWNWQAIRDNQDKIALFYGDDDPYIPQNEFEFIAEQLQPKIKVTKISGGKHFGEYKTFPELLDYITKNYTA